MKYLLSAKSLRPRVKKAALSAPAWTIFHAGRQFEMEYHPSKWSEKNYGFGEL